MNLKKNKHYNYHVICILFNAFCKTIKLLLLLHFKKGFELINNTCVSSRHSQKCVTLLKLRTVLNTNFILLWHIFSEKKRKKNFKLPHSLSLSLRISDPLTFILLLLLVLNFHTNSAIPYFYFILKQPLFVMHSHYHSHSGYDLML